MNSIVHLLFFIQSVDSQPISIVELILRASLTAKIVLLILLIFSLYSWAVTFNKFLSFKKAEAATTAFLESFRSRTKLSDVYLSAESSRTSPVARVFLAGYQEITSQLEAGQVRSIESIGRALQSATLDEVGEMEKSLSWLATTANASPFIGLFGTVVGIVIAFQGLSAASSSTIQSVAPGIAEALIATAAGIAAAVPAAIFYNYFLNKLKRLTANMDRFSMEVLNLIERNYVRVER